MSAPRPPDNDDRTVMPFRATTPTAETRTSAVTSNMLPAGTKLQDEFELIGPVGEGGFGIVYLAYDHTLRRNVAIKEYMPSSLASRKDALTVAVKSERYAETFNAGLKSFVNEARLLAQFDHPSLLKVYRFWEANGTAYMVMPYYEGMSLKDMLSKRDDRPDEVWLKDLLTPLLDALEQLHREHCYHRDISPDNILILNDGRLLLLDFGAARRVIGDMTQSLTVVLRPGYAPVEQYDEMPEMKQGPWTDIYALASVLYFAIMGKPPVSSVARLMSDPLQSLRIAAAGSYSDVFLRGIDKALAVLPHERPQSITELRTALGLRTPLQDPPPRPRLARKTVIRLALASAILLIVAVIGGLLLSRAPKTAPTVATATSTASALHAAVKPFSPATMLDQVIDGRDRAHTVTVSAEKPVVRIGQDRLRFSISASKPGYLYVLTLGTNQSDFGLLFPNGIDRDNRIEAEKVLTLPGERWPLKATGPAGTDRFVAIVSDMPRDFSGLRPTPNDIFLTFPLNVGARLYRDYLGTSPLYSGKTVCLTTPCSPSYGATGFSIEEVN
ncbi:MAG: protein kinase [Gammaproteobacteria bacterium]|nr:protein kinase [Gammaproteobacteria bacterium]